MSGQFYQHPVRDARTNGALGRTLAVLFALAALTSAPLAAQDASAGATPAAAASDEANAARARELFAAGVRLVEEHEFRDAEARFREALALRDAPAIRYNLASVLFERGQYPEADVLARSAAADAAGSPEIREHSAALVAQIAAAAGFLRLDVIGAADATVTLDEYVLPDLGAEFPVAPAEHVLVASSLGVERSRETLTVAAGEHRVVPIDASPPEAAGAEPGLEPDEASTSRPLVEEPALWIGVGAGVLVVAAVIIGVAAASAGTEAPIEGNFNPGVIRW